MGSRRLVITADDFGLDPAVNEAVEIAHRQGVLVAASLMVGAPAVADAMERARGNPRLRVGLHLVLVDGRPILAPDMVPHLTSASGDFSADMASAGAKMFFLPAARRELAAEIEAQFAAFAATGLTLDHVNAHRHFHLHPTIAALTMKIGARHGLRAMRVPTEPPGPLRGAEPEGVVRPSGLVEIFARRLGARARNVGLLVPDQVFGLRWSGAMSEMRLAGLIRALPDGLSEIYLHPATRGGFNGSAAGYRYADELAALVSPGVAQALAESGAEVGGFADFIP
ncbi:MAG: hopanoid biosynthesis-associated protein HpnK [Caulobacteraceae bacterium]